jgi:sugar O-acyltransferase (sialic acid O-acetyltransferase NeuD family)
MTVRHSGLWGLGAPERRPLVIVGAGEFAEIACEYFTHDSPHDVVGFAVEREFMKSNELEGRPIICIDDLVDRFPPSSHCAFVAVTYTKLNRVRARLMRGLKAKGYWLTSYVSSNAFVWRNVAIGDNVFVFENNVVQHHVSLGEGVVLWSGNHIGHRTQIDPYCYIASHVVISGYCKIGAHTFIGVNATIADQVSIGESNLIGAGAVILKSTADNSIYQAVAAQCSPASSLRFYKLKDGE